MERKSTRLQAQGKTSGRVKRKANRKEPIEVSGSDSEETQSMQEISQPSKKLRTDKGEEVSSAAVEDNETLAEMSAAVKKKLEEKKKKADKPEKEEGLKEKSKGKEKEKEKEPETTPSKKKSAEKGKEKETETTPVKEKPEGKKPKIKTVASATKKAYQGKSSLPSNWYISSKVKSLWMGGFSLAKVAFCCMVSESLLEKLQFDFMVKFKESALVKLLNPSTKAYPRLTRLFYLNLVQEDDFIITSRVAGIDMKLDHKVFAKVLGVPKTYNTTAYPDRKECLEKAKELFFSEGAQTGARQLTHSVLTAEAKILFTFFMRCIVPKENSRELVTDKVLITMYLLVQGFEVDPCNLVLEHMIYCASKSRNHPLPYANLLPLFFKFFGVPMKEEEKISSGFGVVDETVLQRLGVVQSEKGGWEFSKVKEGSSSKEQGSGIDHAQLVEKLEDQELELEDLRVRLFDLSSEFSQFKALMGKMDGKLDTVIKGLNLDKVHSATSHDSSDSSGEVQVKKKKKTPVVLSENQSESTEDGSPEKATGVDAATEKEQAQGKDQQVDDIIDEVVADVEAQEGEENQSDESGSAAEVGDSSEKKSKA